MNIAINGFGRIGRLALRAAVTKFPDMKIAAVNTSGSMDIHGWAYLLKYDTAYGILDKDITAFETDKEEEIGMIKIDDHTIPFLAIRDPKKIPWDTYDTDIVLESTGAFRKKEQAEMHMEGGAKRVIISAPAKGGGVKSLMYRLNHTEAGDERVLSNCSCTTYSAAPVIKTVLDTFGIEKLSLTTIHAYTSDQRLLDGSHKKDPRRARAAAQNIIPTSSGSAKAIIEILPELKGKFESSAMRVPVVTGSMSDFTFVLSQKASVQEVNDAFKKAAESTFKGVLAVTNEPLVSSDIIGTDASAIVDLPLTSIIDDTMLKVYAWYDNEWSYAVRLVELAAQL